MNQQSPGRKSSSGPANTGGTNSNAGASSAQSHFEEAHALLTQIVADPAFAASVDSAVGALSSSLRSGGKAISCGNGGSMCDAMHFAEELTGRYRDDRPGMAAVACADPSHITCVANDFGFDQIFSRYVQAIGKPGDVLVAISTSGNSPNVVAAAEMARSMGITVIGLTGKDGGTLAAKCDVEIRVPWAGYADRIQEVHIKVIHALIDGIERAA